MKSNTFSVRGGIPILNGVPVRRVLKCKTETTHDSTIVNMKFEILPQYYSATPRNDCTFDFGFAIEALKQGRKVARKGWNGKGMFLCFVHWKDWSVNPAETHRTSTHLAPWIGMKTADNTFVPWLASQADMLAMDWQIVE